MGPAVTLIDPAAGTDEATWERWAAGDHRGPRSWPRLDVSAFTGGRVVVLAAHPDDEVLGVGGLLVLLARAGARLRLVWASDGEASHPGSSAAAAARMGAVRRTEAVAAATVLGLGDLPREHLGLPDGGLGDHEDELVARLSGWLGPDDVVLAPWCGDGHPDHEACGRAARRSGAQAVEYPVWAWHWARPEDPRVPWQRCRRIDLAADVRERKRAAIAAHRSQVEPVGPGPADAAVLPQRVLRHFRRPYEAVLL